MTRLGIEPLSAEDISELVEIFDLLARIDYENKITEMIEREDPVWFSPLNVIHHASQLNKSLSDEKKKDKKFRKVVEANMAATMLVGLMSA
jgi:hypothetical protein